MFVWILKWVKYVYNKNKCINKWSVDVDWLIKCDSIYYWKKLKMLKNKIIICCKYFLYF